MPAKQKRKIKKKELEKLNVKIVFDETKHSEEEDIQTIAKFLILLTKGALKQEQEKRGIGLC